MAYKDKDKEKEYQKKWYANNKETIKKQHKKWYEDNKEKVLTRIKAYRKNLGEEYKKYHNERHVIYRKNNPEKSMYVLVKSRAKKKNTPFNLDLEDITIPSVCPVLNIPIIKESVIGGKKGPKQCSPSIDRIDNTKGYIKGNIQIISNKANTMKGNATPEELLQFAFWVLLTYGHLIENNS